MKWLEARHLDSWAESTGARERLSEIVAQLVRASAASISEFDFPTGDSAQTPGYDGRLTAIPAEAFRDFLPEGNSVWEWGTGEDCLEKANKDYKKRTENPGQLVDQPTRHSYSFQPAGGIATNKHGQLGRPRKGPKISG